MEIESAAIIDPLWRDAVEEINQLHLEIIEGARISLIKGIRIGTILNPVKNALPHGQWIPWITNHLVFGIRTAQVYLQLFDKRDFLLELLSNTQNSAQLSISRALAVLANPSDEARTPDKPQQLHEPNFYLGQFRLRQTFVGDFYRYLQRKPLRLWETEEINDLLTLINGFSPIIEELNAELRSRSHELVAR